MAVGKASAHLCLTIIIKELKINVEQGRVINNIKYYQTINIFFTIVFLLKKRIVHFTRVFFTELGVSTLLPQSSFTNEFFTLDNGTIWWKIIAFWTS